MELEEMKQKRDYYKNLLRKNNIFFRIKSYLRRKMLIWGLRKSVSQQDSLCLLLFKLKKNINN